MDWLAYADQEARLTYGRASHKAKGKSLLKFGRSEGLDTTTQTVQAQGSNEIFPTTDAITTISSSDAGDTIPVTIEGHTVTGTGTDANFTFVIQSATLAGQTEVALTTPLARVSRVYNAGATNLAGNVYVYEADTVTAGVPQTAAKIHIQIETGQDQSYKAATTISKVDLFYLTGFAASVNKKTTATVDFELQVRRVGGVFRPVKRLTAASTSQPTITYAFEPFVVVPKNSDIRIVAIASTTAVEANASFQAVIAQDVAGKAYWDAIDNGATEEEALDAQEETYYD